MTTKKKTEPKKEPEIIEFASILDVPPARRGEFRTLFGVPVPRSKIHSRNGVEFYPAHYTRKQRKELGMI